MSSLLRPCFPLFDIAAFVPQIGLKVDFQPNALRTVAYAQAPSARRSLRNSAGTGHADLQPPAPRFELRELIAIEAQQARSAGGIVFVRGHRHAGHRDRRVKAVPPADTRGSFPPDVVT